MRFEEYASYDGLGLAALVARKKVSATARYAVSCSASRPERVQRWFQCYAAIKI